MHIALQQYSWLEKGKHHLKRQDEQFYTFESLTSEAATFSNVDLLAEAVPTYREITPCAPQCCLGFQLDAGKFRAMASGGGKIPFPSCCP